MRLAPGDSFDRYVIEGVLGEGGMGRVYLARDRKLERRVALKLLAADPSKGDADAREAAARLLREARAAAALDHLNVVTVYDVGEVDGMPFIAMEHIDGRPLREYVDNPSVDLDRKLRWTLGVARGLAAAHREGLVHRDVKPSNVLVRTQDDVVKVLDFGIARRDSPGEAPTDAPTLTQPGQVLGTPQYMAPEQLRGEPIDGRADQFAWGVLAYTLLAGHSPWKGRDPGTIAMGILTQSPEPLAGQVQGLDPRVDRIVLRALSKSAAERFATTNDLVVDLEEALGERPESTSRRDGRPRDPTFMTAALIAPAPTIVDVRPSRRRRAVTLVLAGATLLAGAAWLGARSIAGGTGQSTPSPSSRATAPASPRPVTMTDLAGPAPADRDTAATYAAAMQAYRDGSLGSAEINLRRVVELDPSFAPAQLRYALLLDVNSPIQARAHFAEARLHRATLTERDGALLEALAPVIVSDPADYASSEPLLRALATRYPMDAEIAYRLGVDLEWLPGRWPDAIAQLDAALALDPKFGAVHSAKGELLMYEGRLDDALRTLDTCLEQIPSSTRCVGMREVLESVRGGCDAVEADARRHMAIGPGDIGAQHWLANARYARGAPLEAAAELLAQERSGMAEGPREVAEREHAFAIAVLRGDFAAAEQAARDEQRIVAADPSRAAHGRPARELVELYREQGRIAQAAAAADDFLRRAEGWAADPRGEDFAVARDPTPEMLETLLRAGRINRGEYAARRDAWLATWKRALSPTFWPYAWLYAWAVPTQTAEEAAAAVAALADFGGSVPPYIESSHAFADVGRTFFLAGRSDAGPWLHMGAEACDAIDFPLAHTRAQLWVARSLEVTGDRDGACKAYGIVLARWGDARGGSVSATTARAAAKALACAK